MARINKSPKTRQQFIDYLMKMATEATGERLRVYRSWDYGTKAFKYRGFEFAGSYNDFRGRPFISVGHEVVVEMMDNGLDADSFIGARKLLGFLNVTFTKADARKARRERQRDDIERRDRSLARTARRQFDELVETLEKISTLQDTDDQHNWTLDRLKEAWDIVQANMPTQPDEA